MQTSSDRPALDAASVRPHRELIAATRPFARECVTTSWLQLLSTFGALAVCLAGASLLPGAWRIVGSVGASLVMIRAFIVFHDHMHGALLRKSLLARLLIRAYGCIVLAPPSAWKKSHDFHHAHVGRLEHSEVGGYRLLSVRQWRAASRTERLIYRLQRSTIVMVLAYPVVFLSSITVSAIFTDPRRHWDAMVAVLMHAAVIVALWLTGGWTRPFYLVLLPMALASVYGAYLFYAQHTHEDARVVSPGASPIDGAMASASYLRMGPVLRWLTGNIGFHHIHHVNAAIPFYALPRAMSAIPEFRAVRPITLRPRDVFAGLRLKLWDEQAGRMIGFAELTPPV